MNHNKTNIYKSPNLGSQISKNVIDFKGVETFFSALNAPPQLETQGHVGENNKLGKWTPEEDQELREKIQNILRQDPSASETSLPWTKIAQGMNRSQRQVRERWFNHLIPGISKKPWESWEDELILREAQNRGHQWAAISSLLPGRTSNQVKNRFHAHLSRKSQREAKE